MRLKRWSRLAVAMCCAIGTPSFGEVQAQQGSVLDIGFIRLGREVSVRVDGVDRDRTGGLPFLRISSSALPDSGVVIHDEQGLDTLAQIAGVVQDGRELLRGPRYITEEGEAGFLWYDSWVSRTPGTRCTSSTRYVERSGDLRGGLITWCETIDADPLPPFTKVESSLVDGLLQVRWQRISEADGYGVLVWDTDVETSRFLEGLRVVSPVLGSTDLEFACAFDGSAYTFGVWAYNVDGPDSEQLIEPYYILKFVISYRPTVIKTTTWGTAKDGIGRTGTSRVTSF